MNQRFAFLLLSFVVLFGCSTSKNTSNAPHSNAYFIIGEGGGFAGTYTQYKINQNGLIQKFDFKESTYKELTRVSPAKVDHFFNQIEELNLSELEISQPGNMSRYIEVNYLNKTDHKLIWPMESEDINPEVLAFFVESYSFCKTLSED